VNAEIVCQISASDAGALKRFVKLERRLVGTNPLFVPDIESNVTKRLAGRSAFFSEMESKLFMAFKGSRDVARCAALINRRYQKTRGETVGFIGYFAAAPKSGQEVQAMLEQAEMWLKKRSVTRVIAPFNGAAYIGMGLLTAAFDEEPVFPYNWNPPYYIDYFEDSGYWPTYPLWYYTIDFTSYSYRTVRRRAAENKTVQIRAICKNHWNRDMEILRCVINETFFGEWEFHPLTGEEVHEIFDQLKPVIDTRQLLLAEVKGKPAGFCLGLPDWNPILRLFKGRLGPVQIVRFLLCAGQYRRAGMINIGVLPEYQGTGVAQALTVALYNRYEERGLKEAFYYPVNESNLKSRGFAESMGGKGRVIYHCYDKHL
jgi:ribosomal protein S18 acetylase RimI-like enzyme